MVFGAITNDLCEVLHDAVAGVVHEDEGLLAGFPVVSYEQVRVLEQRREFREICVPHYFYFGFKHSQ